ncbi:MAG: hypothetical protein K0R51_1223 [Cytophagaceae bacterium]|jgi:hypothetical protein|nr:hypothetical protein [Cytophagaceae bacterium]
MTELKSPSFYFWCCLAQSIVIIGLAFYAGNQKSEKEKLLQEKEMNAFTLTVREAELSRLKAIVDTCYGEKK